MTTYLLPPSDRRRRQNWIDAIVGVNPPLLKPLETAPEDVQAQESPIIETVEASPAGEVEQALEPPVESKFGRIVYPRPTQGAIIPIDDLVNTSQRQEPIENSSCIELALDEKLPSEEKARSIVSQYFISTALKEIRNAPPPARVFSPGQYVRIIEVVGCRNSQFCGSIGIVAEHHFNVWVWVELDGGGRKIVICSPEKLELIELVVATKQEPIALAAKTATGVEVDRVSEAIVSATKTYTGVEVEQAKVRDIDYLDCPRCGAIHSLYATSPGLTTYWEARCIHCDYVKSSVHHPFEYTRPFETPLDRLDFLPIAPTVKTSPGVEVERVQKPIIETVEASPCLEVEQAQEAIEVQVQEPISQVAKTSPGVEVERVQQPVIETVKASPCVEVEPAQEPIIETVEASPGVEVEPAQEAIEVQVQEPISQVAKTSPGVEVERVQQPVIETVKASPCVEVEPAQEPLPNCAECFDDGVLEDEWGFIKVCQCFSETKLSRQMTQRAITPAVKISLDAESDAESDLDGNTSV